MASWKNLPGYAGAWWWWPAAQRGWRGAAPRTRPGLRRPYTQAHSATRECARGTSRIARALCVTVHFHLHPTHTRNTSPPPPSFSRWWGGWPGGRAGQSFEGISVWSEPWRAVRVLARATPPTMHRTAKMPWAESVHGGFQGPAAAKRRSVSTRPPLPPPGRARWAHAPLQISIGMTTPMRALSHIRRLTLRMQILQCPQLQ